MAPVPPLPPGITDSHPSISRVAGHFEASIHAFNEPAGCCSDAESSSFLVCDAGNHCIRRVSMNMSIETLVGVPGERGDSDGDLEVARFDTPLAICRGNCGVWYIADSGNNKVRSFVQDQGVRSLVELPSPQGLTLSVDGTELFVSSGSCVFVVNVDGGFTQRFAGGDGPGVRDGTRLEALFISPGGLCMDSSSGNLLVMDTFGFPAPMANIRCVDSDGSVTTLFQVPHLNDITVDYDGTLIALTKEDIFQKKPNDDKLRSVLIGQEIEPYDLAPALPPAPAPPLMPPCEPGRLTKYFECPRGICTQGSRLLVTDGNYIRAVQGAFGPEAVLSLEVSSQCFCVRWALSGEVLTHVSSCDLSQIESETRKCIPLQRFRLVWNSGEEVSPESVAAAFQPGPAASNEEERATLPLALLLDKDRARAAGVEMQQREMYLNDAEFVEVFGCNVQEFLQFPKWKQQNLKKAKGLF